MIERVSRRALLGGFAATMGTAALPRAALASAARGQRLYPHTHDFIKGFVERRELAGVIAAIGRGQAEPDYFGAGTLALDSTAPVGPDTIWRIYSMTKTVTAIGAMLLIEDGKLRLDQPIADVLPAFANMTVQNTPDGSLTDVRPAKSPITVRQLITHTAGFGLAVMQKGPISQAYNEAGLTDGLIARRRVPGMPPATSAPDLAIWADRLAALPLVYEPGTIWSYSLSLALMGRVIEVVTGQTLAAFLKARLFDPLGMTSTGFQVARADVGRLATNYAMIDGVLTPVDGGADSLYLDPPPIFFGGGGMVSTARDYDRFLAMLLGEGRAGGPHGARIMKPEIARLAMSNLLDDKVETKGSLIDGMGFGAGGRVSLPTSPMGEGLFGWGGAAGTRAFIDRRRGYRVGVYGQAFPPASLPLQNGLDETFYKDVEA